MFAHSSLLHGLCYSGARKSTRRKNRHGPPSASSLARGEHRFRKEVARRNAVGRRSQGKEAGAGPGGGKPPQAKGCASHAVRLPYGFWQTHNGLTLEEVDRKDPSYLGHLVAQHVPQARLNLQQALRDIGRWDGLVANAGPVRRAAAECVLDRSSPPDAPKEVRQLMLIHQQEAQAVFGGGRGAMIPAPMQPMRSGRKPKCGEVLPELGCSFRIAPHVVPTATERPPSLQKLLEAVSR